MRTFDELLDDLAHLARWAPDEADSAKQSLRSMLAAAADHAAKQEREACALVCESRQTPGTGSVAILNGAADEIRARDKPEPPHGWSAERHEKYMEDVEAAGGKE